MTVHQLIQLLAIYDQDTQVYVAGNPDPDSVCKLEALGGPYYFPEGSNRVEDLTTVSEAYSEGWTDEELAETRKVLVVWP